MSGIGDAWGRTRAGPALSIRGAARRALACALGCFACLVSVVAAAAQGTSQWNGQFRIPSPAGDGEIVVDLALDLMLGEATGSGGAATALDRSAAGTATVTFADPNDPGKRYTMQAPASGALASADAGATWSAELAAEFDFRTADAETAQLFAGLGPSWVAAAKAQLTLAGDVEEPPGSGDAVPPPRMTGIGNVNMANLGCILTAGLSEPDVDWATLPGRCGRVDLPAPFEVAADAACAVSPPAETARLFSAMLPAVNHPRCQNCHGAINVFSADTEHLGDDMRKFEEENEKQEEEKEEEEDLFAFGAEPSGPSEINYDQGPVCVECHNLAGGAWEQKRARDIQWAGRSAREVCESWVAATAPGSGKNFAEHVASDTLIRLAFEGNRGMKAKPDPPPMSHETFVAHARAWALAGAVGTARAALCACSGL
jgi:hypothetical protein